MSDNIKTKFMRWLMVILFLWMLSELGVRQLAPHIPWLVGFTWVWAAMLPLLDDAPSLKDNRMFVRLMLAYLTTGGVVAVVIPLFLTLDNDWQAGLIFYAGVISVSGLAFLIYRYGGLGADIGPAAGALFLSGLAMYLVDRYALVNSLPVRLLVVFLLTVSATFCLFMMMAVLTCRYGPTTAILGRVLIRQEETDEDFQPIVDDEDEQTGAKGDDSRTLLPPGRIMQSVGGLLALALAAALLLNLVGVAH